MSDITLMFVLHKNVLTPIRFAKYDNMKYKNTASVLTSVSDIRIPYWVLSEQSKRQSAILIRSQSHKGSKLVADS